MHEEDRHLLEPLLAQKTLLMVAMMVLVIVVGTALDFTPTVLIELEDLGFCAKGEVTKGEKALRLALEEIARARSLPVGTVKSRLHYACRTLKHRLTPERQAADVVRGVPAVS